MKALKYLLVFLMVSSCGPLISYDYERSTDFLQYRSYNYFDDMETGLSPFDKKRMIKAIDDQLTRIGLERKDNADFYIDIASQDIQNRNNSNFGVGFAGTGRNTVGAVSIGIPVASNVKTREIVIDFVDIRNKEKLIWKAVIESIYKPNEKPDKRDEYFENLVQKILANYPPRK